MTTGNEPIQLNPNGAIPITLRVVDWNTVLTVLAEAPWRVSAPLIEAIRAQCMGQIEAAKPALVAASEENPDG